MGGCERGGGEGVVWVGEEEAVLPGCGEGGMGGEEVGKRGEKGRA